MFKGNPIHRVALIFFEEILTTVFDFTTKRIRLVYGLGVIVSLYRRCVHTTLNNSKGRT